MKVTNVDYVGDPTLEDLPGGGVKNDREKLRYDLLPVLPLDLVAEVYTIGAKKYDDRNWESGMAWHRMHRAMLSHALAFWNGETRDPDGGQHHLASVVFCAMALMEYEAKGTGIDDRPNFKEEPNA
jgi:hypothetical protein